MRKVILFIIVILILSGCDLVFVGQTNEDYWCECPQFETIKSALNYCYSEIVFMWDVDLYGYFEYWAAPHETLANMAGDCDDRAILFAYIAHSQFQKDPEIIYAQKGLKFHLYVRIDGKPYLDNKTGSWNDVKVYSYSEIMWIATHSHGITPLGKSIQ